MASKEKTYYLIHYRDPKDGQVIELKANRIEDSSLGLSFVKISEFLFETNALLIKPSEEQLKKRFENVKSIHVSIYSIISIEELGLDHDGLKFKKDRSNLIALPK